MNSQSNHLPPNGANGSHPHGPRPGKRMALYARVSTQEQTKGQYPSCTTQIEEMEAFCATRGWEVFERIKDEGHRAGTLKRPGLTYLRSLVETNQIDGVICTWYNRLIGSRDFYVLDKEFKNHNVQLITIHDPADRNSAAGRLMESMLVTIKTFENEQIGEKVRTKMRMRAEKGMWNGGLVPFGFRRDPQTHILSPDPEKAPLVQQMFRVYVEKQSDFAVRDWLRAHQIPSPNGQPVWRPASIRDLLSNRRYIAEIEINRRNKGLEEVPESEAYHIVPAPHDPIVSRELFDLAQGIRGEKALESPNRKGRPHGYSQNKCNRVYPLQGRLVCGECGHAMTPYYVVHKPGKNRRNESYIYYYICSAQQMTGPRHCGHSNRVLARVSESCILERIEDLVHSDGLLEQAFEMARIKCQGDLQPEQEELNLTRRALQENQAQIDKLFEVIGSGGVQTDLLVILNEKATELRQERERLRAEQRRLTEAVRPLSYSFDPAPFRALLSDFSELSKEATPEELQRLLQVLLRRIEWMPDGSHQVEFYLPQMQLSQRVQVVQKPQTGYSDQAPHPEKWLERNVWSGCPGRTRTSDQAVNSRPLYH
jgi:site-specific DNA recombinase